MNTVKNLEIRVAMLEHGISQADLGKMLKMSQPHVSTMLSRELADDEKKKIIKLIEEEVKQWKN